MSLISKISLGACVLLGGLISACGNDSPSDASGEKVLLNFNIVMSGGTDTRADDTWGSDYDPSEVGDDFENNLVDIHPGIISVNADGSSGNSIGDISILSKRISKLADGRVQYAINGRLNTDKTLEELKNGNYRLIVSANTDATVVNPVNGLSECYYTLKTNANSMKAIPMWGVHTFDFNGLVPGESYDMGDVELLRSVANVRIIILDELFEGERNVKIKYLRLNRVNNCGYLLPANEQTRNSLAETTDLIISNSINAVADASHLVTDYTVSSQNGEKTLSFYLPETVNSRTLDASDDLILTVGYVADGISEPMEGQLHFCEYTDEGKPAANAVPWDIVRNHIYEYTITGVGSLYKPELQVCVKRWYYHKIKTEL